MSITLSQTSTVAMGATESDEQAPNGPVNPIADLKKMFPGVVGYLTKSQDNTDPSQGKELEGADPKQAEYMKEVCIILDEDDKPIAAGSKKICTLLSFHTTMLRCSRSPIYLGHLTEYIDRGLLHRAFSVFLFDSKNRLLLQQRAGKKITFPSMWTNTCCSHPLNVPEEAGIDLEDATVGVKRAAIRKLWDEVRIKVADEDQEAFLEKFHFLTRIQYKAKNISPEDPKQKWSEHESEFPAYEVTPV